MSNNIRKASPCEKAETIIVDAMEHAQEQYSEYIAALKNKEDRLEFIDRYAATLSVLSDALQNISLECSSKWH